MKMRHDMGKQDTSQGREVHMIRSLVRGGEAYTCCGGKYFESERWTILWEYVTCLNCLRCRKDEETMAEDGTER